MSFTKTYLPTLVRLLHHVCNYIVRYQETLNKHLTTDQQAKLAAVVTACNIFTATVPPPTIGG